MKTISVLTFLIYISVPVSAGQCARERNFQDTSLIAFNPKKSERPSKADYLLKAKNFPVGLYIDSSLWMVMPRGKKNSNIEFELALKSHDGFAELLTDQSTTPLEKIPGVILTNFKETISNGELVYEEYRTVNNIKMLYVGMRGTLHGKHLIFLRYYFSTDQGTVQLSTLTSEVHWNDVKMKMQDLLNGLVGLEIEKTYRVDLKSPDVTNLLCRRWVAAFALDQGMKIGLRDQDSRMTYDFNPDHSFSLETNHNLTKGVWNYDGKTKTITLTTGKTSKTGIISLSTNELIMLINTNGSAATPKGIKIICIPKN